MTTSKLPEWPEAPCTNEGVTFRQRRRYLERTTNAALARMEALVLECGELLEHADDRISGADRRRIAELLADCERKP